MSQTSTSSEDMCHICERISSRDSAWKQPGLSNQCVLCDRPFCKMHQTPTQDDDDVCEADHRTYHRVHHHMLPGRVFISKQNRREKLGNEVIPSKKEQNEGGYRLESRCRDGQQNRFRKHWFCEVKELWMEMANLVHMMCLILHCLYHRKPNAHEILYRPSSPQQVIRLTLPTANMPSLEAQLI